MASAVAALLVPSIPSIAHAQMANERPGFYLGAGLGSIGFDGDNGIGGSSSAFTGRVGWQLNKWFAVEGDAGFGFDDGEFTFNADEEDFNLDDNDDGDVADVIGAPGEFGMNYMAGAYLKVSYPIQGMSLYGRLGYAIFDVDSTVVTPGGTDLSISDSESGASYGGGAEFSLAERHSILAEYTYTDFDLAEANALGFMYQFKF
jgi:opacity protein-like surface antigen